MKFDDKKESEIINERRNGAIAEIENTQINRFDI